MCERQEVAIGILLLGAGLVFVILGVKLYKLLVPISFAAIGLVTGIHLPVSGELAQSACGIVLAAALGVGSSYFNRLAVALLAGGWTGVFAASLAVTFGIQQSLALAIGAVFLLAVASLALPLYQQVIAYVTSLQGAMLTIGGLIAVLHAFPTFWAGMRGIVTANSYVAPFFVVSLTVMGYYLQSAETRQIESGMSG
ncbi:MAG: hypothetical protein ACUVXJ_11320 [Phycisphaerae bacterium]